MKKPLFSLLVASVSFGLYAEVVDLGSAAEFVSNLTENPAGDYKLTTNIDLADAGYTTIAEFSGTLDGNGCTLTGLGAQALCVTNSGSIAGLTIDGAGTTWSTANNGVFCRISYGGRFADCTAKGYTLKLNAGSQATGFIAGTVLEGSKFVRCVTDSSCEIKQNSKANSLIGGIAGKVYAMVPNGIIATFEDCVNNATISATGDNNNGWGAGGLVGKIESSSAASVPEVIFTRCVNNGPLTTTGGNSNLGGILAQITGSNSKDVSVCARLVGCVNNGTISATCGSNFAGGIVAWSSAAACVVMDGCVNRADINVPSFNGAAGLLGAHNPYATNKGKGIFIRNSANYGAITAKDSGGLIGKYDVNTGWNNGECRIFNCANYGTVTGTGNVGELVAYFTSGTGDLVLIEVKNCWTKATPLYTKASKAPVTEGLVSTADAGYTDAGAITALNGSGVAEYATWVAGTDGRPELGMFAPAGAFNLVLFYDWDGTLLKQEVVQNGQSATPPADPSRESFTFTGWNGSYTSVSAPTTVIPNYVPLSFTISFDAAGGTACESAVYKYGDVVKLPITQRDGYEFVCWAENLARRVVVTCPDYDLALTAVWRAIKTPPAQQIKVLQWQLKGTNSGTRQGVVNAVAAECAEQGAPDVFIMCGCENSTTIAGLFETAFPGYTFVARGSNGSVDANSHVIGYDASRFEAGVYTSVMPTSNATTGYLAIHELGTDNYFVVFDMYYNTTKTLQDYLNAFGSVLTTARNNYPTATFVAGAANDHFPDSPVYASTYGSDPARVLAAYKEESGLVELQAGDDFQWTLYLSAYTDHPLTEKSVTKVENASASTFPGYFTAFQLGTPMTSGLMLLIR